MPGPPNNPHDALARRVLGNPVNAASELRAVLPPALVSRLDLDRLALVDGSFVDEELKSRYTDLLYRAPLDDREAFIYVLIEHQSSTDEWMPFRMLMYLMLIWDRCLKQRPKPKKLPVVVPLVLYHDTKPWSGPVEFRDLVCLDPGWADAVDEFVPRFRFLLHDLSQVDEQALRAMPVPSSMRVSFWLWKVARGNTRLGDDLEGWDTENDFLDKLGPDVKETFMTTAEMLRDQGRTEGLAEGHTKGLAEGRAETVVKLMTVKFGALPDTVLTTVREATPEQLETWAVRLLTADTIDEILH